MSTPTPLYAYQCVYGIVWRMCVGSVVIVANTYCISIKGAYEEISNPHPMAAWDISALANPDVPVVCGYTPTRRFIYINTDIKSM